MTDDLVQRLRSDAGFRKPSPIMREAADALERLQADNQRWKAERAEVVLLQQALSDAYDTLVHVRTMHQPKWASEQAKAAGKDPWVCLLCGTADGHWPCDTADITDDALAAARAVLEGNQQ